MFAALAFVLGPSVAHAATYEVDPAHSMVGFSVTHMGFSTVRGFFGTVSGTVEIDPSNPSTARVDGKVGVESVNTMNQDRDDHLRNPDFFDVARFPEMTFRSTAVRNVTNDGFDLVGDFTLHGVTKEVVFHVARLSAERTDPWGNTKVATTATTTLNRKDFGMSWNKQLDQGGWLVGEEVQVTLDLELKKTK